MTRKKISIVRLLETPQAQEAMAKAVVDHRNSFTSPTRLASQPVIGMELTGKDRTDYLAQVKEVLPQLRFD